jgi:hypothetical protein
LAVGVGSYVRVAFRKTVNGVPIFIGIAGGADVVLATPSGALALTGTPIVARKLTVVNAGATAEALGRSATAPLPSSMATSAMAATRPRLATASRVTTSRRGNEAVELMANIITCGVAFEPLRHSAFFKL